MEFSTRLSKPEHWRALAKIPLEMLAHFRSVLARRPELAAAARCARHGKGDVDLCGDGETVGLVGSQAFLHQCEAWTAGSHLIGRVVIFGILPFTVPLATDWQDESVSIVHVEDPVNGRVVLSGASTEDGPLPPGWPTRTGNLDALQGYVARFGPAASLRMWQVTLDATEARAVERWQRELAGREPNEPDLTRRGLLVGEESK